MSRVRSQDQLQGFDPEPKRTFHMKLSEARDINNIHALVQFPGNMAEEQHMAVQEVAMPSIANVTSSIVKPRITRHFELKQSMIQLLHANGQFMGLPHEDPQQHILNFLEISDTYITNGVTPDNVRLTLFPFSLLGEAKRCLKAEPANSIISWNDLTRKFLTRFFPSGKTAKIRNWERFKGLIRDCPHHKQTREVLAHTFIEGLHPKKKIVLDATAGGQVLEKSFDEIYALLKKFSKSNPDWQGEMGRHTVQKSTGVLELDVVSSLSAQISTLTNQVNQMTLIINKQQAQPGPNKPIWEHLQSQLEELPKLLLGWKPRYSDQYRPQAPQQQYRPPQFEQQQAHAATNRNLERQLGQLASSQNNRPAGALPSDIEANPKVSLNVVTLRNERQLEEVQSKKGKHVTFNERPTTIESTSEKSKESEKPTGEAVAEQPPPLVARPPPPFPQRLQKLKDDVAYKKFLDILKQVQINILLVDILQEVPKYAKYIKDIVANKRRLTEFETMALTEECGSRIQGKLPQKLKDPSSFTIQISIGKHTVGRALCDPSIHPFSQSLTVLTATR
ncbi:uncharacterized protein LOC142176414 [Nicotiana tabacum]|uniref:Uncharacterized protein LOC142176414 n=1 Tax=Nicotiana tabacum TaxID=4097 RepID=A0AC58TSC9_TOBAC